MGKSKPSAIKSMYNPSGKSLRDAYNFFYVFEKRIPISDTIYLRPCMDEDLSFFEEHFNKDYVQSNLYITTDRVETYLNALINKPENQAYTIVDGKVKIGMYNFKNLNSDFPSTTCWLSPDAQGKGIIRLVKEKAFPALNITKLYAEIYKTNVNSQKMALKFGYKFLREEAKQFVYVWEKDGQN